jgi:outer membrane protein TolC
MASSLELTQANNQYLNSNSAYTNAILELLNAKVTLDKTLNNL